MIIKDVIGVEICGALRGPIAIGAGMLIGRHLGMNTIAAYVTKASLELQDFCYAMGGLKQTVCDLSGLGGFLFFFS